jgi:hypothetical protein
MWVDSSFAIATFARRVKGTLDSRIRFHKGQCEMDEGLHWPATC